MRLAQARSRVGSYGFSTDFMECEKQVFCRRSGYCSAECVVGHTTSHSSSPSLTTIAGAIPLPDPSRPKSTGGALKRYREGDPLLTREKARRATRTRVAHPLIRQGGEGHDARQRRRQDEEAHRAGGCALVAGLLAILAADG